LITAIGAVPTALLHRRMAFKAFAVRQLFAITAGGAAGVTFAILGAGPWALVAQALASAVVGSLVVLVKARWRPRMRFSKRHWRDIAGFGTVAMGIDLLDLLKEDASWATTHNITMLIFGCVVAFVVALLAMKWFVGYLAKYGFKAFGIYRIIVGSIIIILLLTGHSLAMVD
jgi:threonine dehydrogenase-like Zn-dependent dehydrogenase